MARLPLLRAAVLAAVALFPAAAFIGGCDSQPGSKTASASPASTAPPDSTAPGGPKKKTSTVLRKMALVRRPVGVAFQAARQQPDETERQPQPKHEETGEAHPHARRPKTQRQARQPAAQPNGGGLVEVHARRPKTQQETQPQPKERQPATEAETPKQVSPPDVPAQPAVQPNGDGLVEAFISASLKRVRAHSTDADNAHTSGGRPTATRTATRTACERLVGWPSEVDTAVDEFLEYEQPWTPPAIIALRDEVEAITALVRCAVSQSAEEEKNYGGRKSEACQRLRTEMSLLTTLERSYSGLLVLELVENDRSEPQTAVNPWETQRAADDLVDRRNCRLDQLALRSDGPFGELLPAASVETCDELIKLDNLDLQHAKNLIGVFVEETHLSFGGVESLVNFVDDRGDAAKEIRSTRDRLSKAGRKIVND